MKKWKLFDRLAILFFNLFLLLSSFMIPAVCLAASPTFYHTQFEKTGIYATVNEDGELERKTFFFVGGNRNEGYVEFTDEQIDQLADHIIRYLFTGQDSFALTMDGVSVMGKTKDGVQIFGEKAVSHMAEVKALFHLVILLSVVFVALLIALGVYMVWRRNVLRPLYLPYTLIFYGSFLALAGSFCLVTAIQAKSKDYYFLDLLWTNIHYILFPFQPDSFAGSFFNDTLTELLSLELFMAAVVTILIVFSTIFGAWLAFCITEKVLANKQKSPRLENSATPTETV